jgi:formate-dependent nitrite reductase membrane component NrfD
MSNLAQRLPDAESERRLAEIRRKAAEGELPQGDGVHPVGAPFPQVISESQTIAEKGYYGIPLLKEPQWTKEVPLYFFAGGTAGAAAVIASIARHFSGAEDLARSARWMAAAGALISPALLTSDLGKPSRFLNMLRVFKLQSPMSVGAWTLTAFSSAAAAAAFAGFVREKISDRWPIVVVENASEMLAAATGLVMSSYTGVLIGATVIPVWNENIGTLPIHFAASGMNSSVSILELMGHDDSRALNMLGIAASAYETVEGAVIESRQDRVNRPLKQGKSGLIVRLGGVLSGPVPLLLRLGYAITGNKKMRRAAAVCSIAGSLLTRFGWVEAGKASARDHVLSLTAHERPTKEPSTPSMKISPALSGQLTL